jgi:hypothetical protein
MLKRDVDGATGLEEMAIDLNEGYCSNMKPNEAMSCKKRDPWERWWW